MSGYPDILVPLLRNDEDRAPVLMLLSDQISAKYWRNRATLRRFSDQPVAEIVQCGEPRL
jgi:hypothetical protein